MAVVSPVVDSLFGSSDYQGQVQGVNLMRADTTVAAGNPSTSKSRGDSVTISSDSSASASASYKGTAAANKASADSSTVTQTSDAKSGQQQELQALSAVTRMQRAYASTQPTIASSQQNSFRELFQVRQGSVAEASQGSKLGASVLSQGVVSASPAVNVATNATASSMLLAQQPQLTGIAQAAAERNDVERPIEVSSTDEIEA